MILWFLFFFQFSPFTVFFISNYTEVQDLFYTANQISFSAASEKKQTTCAESHLLLLPLFLWHYWWHIYILKQRALPVLCHLRWWKCFLLSNWQKTQSQQTQGSKLAQKELKKPGSCGELLLLQRIYGFLYRSQKYIMDQEDNHKYKENKYVLLHPILKCPTYKTIHCNPHMKHSLALYTVVETLENILYIKQC